MSFKHKRRPKHRGTENTEGHRDFKNGFQNSSSVNLCALCASVFKGTPGNLIPLVFPSCPSSSLGTHLSRNSTLGEAEGRGRQLLSPETALCLQATSSLLEAGASRTMALPSWSLVTRGTTGTATSGINGN